MAWGSQFMLFFSAWHKRPYFPFVIIMAFLYHINFYILGHFKPSSEGKHWHFLNPRCLQIAYRSFATRVSQLKICDFQERILKVLKCYNFLWVQRRHNCSTAARFANCVMTLNPFKVHPQTFLSIPINQKCQNFELWHSCRKRAIWITHLRSLSQIVIKMMPQWHSTMLKLQIF